MPPCERTVFPATSFLCYYGYGGSEYSKSCFVMEPIIDIDKSWILCYFSVYVVASRGLPQGPFEVTISKVPILYVLSATITLIFLFYF